MTQHPEPTDFAAEGCVVGVLEVPYSPRHGFPGVAEGVEFDGASASGRCLTHCVSDLGICTSAAVIGLTPCGASPHARLAECSLIRVGRGSPRR